MKYTVLKITIFLFSLCIISACQTTPDITPTPESMPVTVQQTAAVSAVTQTPIALIPSPTQTQTQATISPTSLATLTSTPPPALADANTSMPSATHTAIPQVVVVFNAVNLRKGPGLDYPISSFMYKDDIAKIIAVHGGDNGWYNIRLADGRLAWVGVPVVEPFTLFDAELIPTAATIPATVTPTPTNTLTPTYTPVPKPPRPKPTKPLPTTSTSIPMPTETVNPYP